jgi:hypothetical protein
LRRSVREIKILERYHPSNFHSNFDLYIIDDDPITFKEGVDSKDGKVWENALHKEMVSLDKNEFWDLVELLTRRNPIRKKWVFKNKY